MTERFIPDTVSRLKYYKSLGDKAFEQLADADLFYQPNAGSNSIAVIIQHLYGNMMSRFTDFLTSDGEKPWRNRDAEFEPMQLTRQDLLDFWNTGWATVFSAIEPLQPADLERQITIRSEQLYVYDAILRQLAHYPYHVGQIVYIAKILKDHAWQSLSIPRGSSRQFNARVEGGEKGLQGKL